MDVAEVNVEPIYAAVGDRVKAARMEAGWTQQDLCGQIGLSRTSIANIELGRQRLLLHQVFLLADALSVSVSDLIGVEVARPTADRQAIMAAERENRRLRQSLAVIANRAHEALDATK